MRCAGHRFRLSDRAYARWFLLLVALVLLLSDKGQIAGDGIVRWQALDSLLTEGRLTADKYSIVQPVLAVPLYVAGELWASATGMDAQARERTIRSTVKRFNKLVAFGIAAWFYAFLRRAGGWPPRAASLGTAFLLFGSLLIPHAKDFYSECLWTLLSLLSLSLLASLHARSCGEVGIGKAAGAVVLTALLIPLNPILSLVLAGLAILLTLERLRRRERGGLTALVRPDVGVIVVALVCGAGLCMMENQLRRGSPVDFGYSGEGFTTPLWYGLAGQLLAPARGLVYFAPALFFGPVLWWRWRGRLPTPVRPMVALSLLYSLLLVMAFARWHAWHGSWYWGPRFLLPLSVLGCLFFALSARLTWPGGGRLLRGALVATGLMSYMVYKVGVGVGQRHLVACLQGLPATDHCYWQLRFLPYASWLDAGDLVAMLTHRSTLVEALAAVALIVLARHAPDGRAATSSPESC